MFSLLFFFFRNMDAPAFLEGEGDPAEVEGAGPAIHAPFSLDDDLGMGECIEPVDVGAVEAELKSLLPPPSSSSSAALPTTSAPTPQPTPSSFHHIATAQPFSPQVRIWICILYK
jgi:hypothetical protein